MVGAEGCTALEEEGLANPSKFDSLVLVVYVPIPYFRTRPCFCSPEPDLPQLPRAYRPIQRRGHATRIKTVQALNGSVHVH